MIDTIARWFAWCLPRVVVYWATVRVASFACSGKYAGTDVDTITFKEASTRWDRQ